MNTSLEQIINQADALYDIRDQPGKVRASLQLLERGELPAEYEVVWRIGRAYFFLGQQAGRDDAAEFHSHGIIASERAVKLDPLRVEGQFWLGVNLALLATASSSFKAIRCALRARRILKHAVSIDANYHGAGPLRVLARLQHKLPLLLGGGTSRARTNFERAIGLAPGNTVTRLYFAELLLEVGDIERARHELNSLLNMSPESGWDFETTRDRRIARQILTTSESHRSGPIDGE